MVSERLRYIHNLELVQLYVTNHSEPKYFFYACMFGDYLSMKVGLFLFGLYGDVNISLLDVTKL